MSKKGKRRLPSLRMSLLFLFAVSWLIPVAVLSYFIFNQYQNAYIDRTESDVMNAVNVSGVLIKSQIDSAVTKVNKQTTGGEWERMYRNVQTGAMERAEYLTQMRSQLLNKYYMDSQFSCVALYLTDEEGPQTYTGKTGYEYETYLDRIDATVRNIIDEKEKLTRVEVIDGEVYLIQNLFFSSYDRIYGTLVVGMTKEELFKDVPLEEPDNVFVEIDESGVFLTKEDEAITDKKLSALSELKSGVGGNTRRRGVISTLKTGYAGFGYQADSRSFHMSLYYLKDTEDMYYEISRLNLIVLITVIGMIPLMIYSYISMKKNAQYLQRMATKDAQIAALQAQINPHFLNNTLEMMNWQARMNGDTEISKMIEALGTVLDSGINRENDKLVRLSEELRCGDAFLYIMSMRFGQRLTVEKLVDRNVLQVMVPQLILQPILENAIKHGVESVNSGTIWLNIFEEDGKLVIDVINSGKKLADADIERIRKIISGEQKPESGTPGVHTSIGIYNVNKRIELIFGEEYGLSVNRIDDDKLQFRMLMPLTVSGM
ncbi:MAG: histidine kinase [Butyrivibrio sp.]|nr:histidine kinase [Butyrivibrio sp.]